MTSPSHAEITKVAWERLSQDAPLSALVGGRVFNHLPQDEPLPAVRVRWETSDEWDTKDSAGFSGALVVDTWTDHRGDKQAQTIADRVDALLHLAPFTGMTSGQSLLLRHDFHGSFTEPDGLTHHTVQRFTCIVTT